jgi:hypothetical protein
MIRLIDRAGREEHLFENLLCAAQVALKAHRDAEVDLTGALCNPAPRQAGSARRLSQAASERFSGACCTDAPISG